MPLKKAKETIEEKATNDWVNDTRKDGEVQVGENLLEKEKGLDMAEKEWLDDCGTENLPLGWNYRVELEYVVALVIIGLLIRCLEKCFEWLWKKLWRGIFCSKKVS